MKKIKWTYKKYFFFKETTTATTKKQKKCQKIEVNGVEKMKFNMYIGPLLSKWQRKPSFQQRLFWPPYRSNRTLRAYWMSNCPQIFTNCHRGLEVFSTPNFWAIILSTYWLLYQIRQKHPKTPKNQECVRSITCWRVTCWKANSWCIVTKLNSTVDARIIGTHSLQGAKKKDLLSR